MRVLVQRVSSASVAVDGTVVSAIGRGLLAFVGVRAGDGAAEAARLAAKVVALRIFEDAEGRMNRSLVDAGGDLLAISQFTLYADTRRGNRPSFTGAAPPDLGRERYEAFCTAVEAAGVRCGRGVFGAHLEVSLVNDGPVTILLDSEELARPRHA